MSTNSSTGSPSRTSTMLARVRKSLVAGAGALASIVALNVLPERYQAWAVAVLALATAGGVYATPNRQD